MIFPRGFQLLLILGCTLSLALAYDISKRLEPPGKLKVRLDFPLARTWPDEPENYNTDPQPARTWFWSSHLKFKKPVEEITDGQLWKIALDAYNEVPADMKQYGIRKGARPSAMTVLAFDHEIILASSQKGDSFAYNYPDTPVLKSLQLCQSVWKDVVKDGDNPHNNGGKCGEPMATQLYYTENKTPLKDRDARIATIVWGRQVPPCGDSETSDIWGCNLFVYDQGAKVIDIKTPSEKYDLKTLAGGVTFDQIQLCSG
ncbi:hypothetical protein P170DRAFT_357810 [Aspergillus steynii IBT 23096]|uniref:Uncharacterized protein n=1 Tax=Aspergillus steynii IBT 23096 TaxID=1392250 RepID=A0A2I2G7I0_9EURO|nr:uncharacterized protein P170DRAFT_357810 [Aspergillus steynii IBT 23096]PLB48818.1 hypothetical protein P170DRAFT_357810 [Aspergillus steynii IBT 23096]